ncbi:MAG: winged helix-turn-helix domain-containing protein [Nanoarchaeota archaeon]
MAEEFKYFNKHERKILNLLYRARIKMSTLSISKRLGMHWTTAEESLTNLEDKGWVIREDMSNKTLWQFNYEKYEEEKRRK